MRKTPPPPIDIADFIAYDPITGLFWWKKYAGGNSKSGRLLTSHNADGYLRVNFRGVEYKLHNLAWFFVTGEWPSELVDHENLDVTDNSFSNLRSATKSQNSANARKIPNTTSQFKGVTWNKRCRKWQAQIRVDGKHRYLGLFENEYHASQAYALAARESFGPFARMS